MKRERQEGSQKLLKMANLVNLEEVSTSLGLSDFIKSFKGYLSKQPNAFPNRNFEVVYLDSLAVAN